MSAKIWVRAGVFVDAHDEGAQQSHTAATCPMLADPDQFVQRSSHRGHGGEAIKDQGASLCGPQSLLTIQSIKLLGTSHENWPRHVVHGALHGPGQGVPRSIWEVEI